MRRRRRSPSHSDNNNNYNNYGNNNNNNILNSAFNNHSNTTNSSQNLNNASNNEDINSNEPTEPDDSRLLPASKYNKTNTDNIDISTDKGDGDRRPYLSSFNKTQDLSIKSHKRSASPAPLIKPPLISTKDVQPFNIPNSIPLTSTTATNIVTSLQPSVGKNIRSSTISNNTTTTAAATTINTINSASLSDSLESSSTPFSSIFSSTSVNSLYSSSSFTSSLTSSFKKFSSNNSGNSSINKQYITEVTYKTKHNSSIFLKRYPNDNSSKEGINLDDMITKLLKFNNSNGSSKHKKHSSSSSSNFPIHSWEIQLICSHVREIFLMQPTLLKLQSPIKIVGDIHGQYNDLLRIFKLSGDPSETNYLFLGDYIDRGHQSLETIMLLFCYKIKYRDNFFMLRGNHESANVTKMYGFYDECKRRKSTKIWKCFIDVFNCLPIAAMIQDKIFCIHGGISPDLTSMKQISNVLRPTDIPDEGLITDLLWSDPDSNVATWSPNDRGVSYTFSRKNVLDFCSKFKFDLIIRGHMVVEDGYEFFAKKKFVTIFSAPNYCGQFGNWGAVLSISTGLICSFELLKPHSIKR